MTTPDSDKSTPPLEPEFIPVVDGLNEAAALAEKGEFDAALARLGVAEGALPGIPEVLRGSARGLALTAALAEGRGQIGLRQNDFESAYRFLGEAEQLRQKEVALGGRPNPLARAVSNLNLSSAAQRLGHIPEALEHNARCRALLAETDDPNARIFVAAAAEAHGTLLAMSERFDEALVPLGDGLTVAREMADAGFGPARTLTAEILVNKARVHHLLKQSDDAMTLTTEAAEIAFSQLEASQFRDQQAASLYISAEMNQLNYAEALGSFAKGEDALFRVLKLVGPNPRVIERGMAYFKGLLDKDDAALEAGDLPRDEVEESLGRLEAMLAQPS